MDRQILIIGIRWVAAISLLIAAFVLAPKGPPTEDANVTQAAALTFKSIIMMLAAVALVVPEVIALVTRGAQAILGSIFFPTEAGVVAPPNYKIVRFYRQEARYEEAVEQCLLIVTNHPHEARAYGAGIENAILAGSAEDAEKFLAMARRKLQNAEEIEYVEAIYNRAKSMDYEDLAAEEMEPDANEENEDGYANGANGYGGPTGGYGAG